MAFNRDEIRCTTHHHACDCREYAYRQRIEALEAALDARRKESELKHYYQITLEQRIEALEAAADRVVFECEADELENLPSDEAVKELKALLPGG